MVAVKQRDVSDCGAACLCAIASWYGYKQSVTRYRLQTGTTLQGTTVLGMVEAAELVGFTAKGVRGTYAQATSAPLPAIAHCLKDGRLLHYVVLVAIHRGHVEVMDPAEGRVLRWSVQEFQSCWTGVLILLEPGAGFRRGDHTVPPWRRCWQLLRPHRWDFSLAALAAVLSAGLALATAIFVQQVVDRVIPAGNRFLLDDLALVMLLVLGCRLLLAWIHTLISLRTTQRIDATLMLSYYRHLLRLPQVFFDTMRLGEITARLGDAARVRHFLSSGLLSLVLNPLIVVLSVAGLFFYSVSLGLAALGLLPLSALIYWLVDRRSQVVERNLMERGGDFGAQFTESLGAQSVIRRFRLEGQAIRSTEQKLRGLIDAVRQSTLLGFAGGLGMTLLTQVSLVALLWLGGRQVVEARLSLGELMSCFTLVGCISGPLTSLVGLNTTIRDALIATDRLYEVMDLELESDAGAQELRRFPVPAVRLERLSFRHAGRRAILSDVNLHFPPGRITVLVGESGCGKSTILSLIQRLYEPIGGRVLFGQEDARAFTLRSLRSQLAVVPQTTVLLSGTVLENLAPGVPQPDIPRLQALCGEVGVLALIENLPRGFMTHLTENGANLSGGQRQRLALVRALYLDAPVLLLDEPTAALDPASETRVLALLARERGKGKTIIVAAHHPAVVACADLVYDLTPGAVSREVGAVPESQLQSIPRTSAAPA